MLMLKVFAVIELVLLIVHPCAYALSRDQFPPDFVFGASTSAYQVLLSPFLSFFTLFTVIVFPFFAEFVVISYEFCERLKVQQMKMAESQAYGTPSLILEMVLPSTQYSLVKSIF